MKYALDKSGQVIEAGEGGPTQGHCPQCGAPVILRRRNNGKRGVTYFWRHQDGLNLDCPARFSAARPAGAGDRPEGAKEEGT